MTNDRLKEFLIISTAIRNGALCLVLIVVLGFMLYVMLSPADELPAVRNTSGGIPVTDSREANKPTS
ncbi:MAG: hypothetical protein WC749_00955 [Dehalococcoidia bacterium]|uniref:hypothetical protein n=1 Tax=unclassified Pseudomonas TaxID=196821 RepID=UPI001473FB8B|nr:MULTISPECIES: hypothetical protein [unclassified Pseudomonas]NMX92494.1 hypothetical protein [Pseudomonas sp. WS 5086]NMY47228.1 hypothetical protein [Pseudomonas sp. WS 5027]